MTNMNDASKETGMFLFFFFIFVHALTVARTINHKINVEIMLELNVINTTVVVTKLDFAVG